MKHGEDDMVTLVGTDQVTEELASSAPNAFGPGKVVVTDNREASVFELRIDGQTAAGLLYKKSGRRVTLLATSVFPEFRGRGIAGALIGQVLDMLRAERRTVTLSCPFAMAFVRSHPEYADVLDPDLPGNAHSLGHYGAR